MSPKINICPVCKNEIMPNIRQWYNQEKGLSIHLDCGEKKLDLWKIEVPGLNSYLEYDISSVPDMLKEMDEGSQYLITKTKMTAIEYFSLKEFEGF